MSYAVVIGGANIDILGYPLNNKLIRQDSNPGVIKTSTGGVGRNIAENMARLGIKTVFLGVVGKDFYGNQIIQDSKNAGIDMSNILITEEENTSTYLCILNEKRDMDVAICHMGITDKINEQYLEKNKNIINGAELIIIDGNFKEHILNYLITKYGHKKILFDPVSSTKALHAKNIIGGFYAIKPNRIEAETLSKIKIRKKEDYCKVGEYFLKKGTKEIYITDGENGVYFTDRYSRGFYKPKKIKVYNVTGAGDAFVAGLAYGIINCMSMKEKAVIASKCALYTLQTEDTINKEISKDKIASK